MPIEDSVNQLNHKRSGLIPLAGAVILALTLIPLGRADARDHSSGSHVGNGSHAGNGSHVGSGGTGASVGQSAGRAYPSHVGGQSWSGHRGGGSGWGNRYYPRYYYPGSSFWWWGDPFWSAGWYGGWPYGYYNGYYGYGSYGYGYGYRTNVGAYGARGVQSSRYGAVKTDVQPDEAEVWLDGKYIGTADDFDGHPDMLYLQPGSYHLEFKLPGHEGYALDVEAVRGQRTRIDHRLKRLSGTPRLAESPAKKGMPYGRIFGPNAEPVTERAERSRREIQYERRYQRNEDRDRDDNDGEDMDRRPPPRRGMDRPDGPRIIEERRREDRDRPAMDRDREGNRDHDGDMDRDHDRDRDRIERRERRSRGDRARLRMKVTPDDAAVYVDDKYVGTAGDLAHGFFTSPGKHTITVTRPGYKTRTVETDAKGGGPVDVVVELER